MGGKDKAWVKTQSAQDKKIARIALRARCSPIPQIFQKWEILNHPLDDLVVYELLLGMEYNICVRIKVDTKVNGRNSGRIVE